MEPFQTRNGSPPALCRWKARLKTSLAGVNRGRSSGSGRFNRHSAETETTRGMIRLAVGKGGISVPRGTSADLDRQRETDSSRRASQRHASLSLLAGILPSVSSTGIVQDPTLRISRQPRTWGSYRYAQNDRRRPSMTPRLLLATRLCRLYVTHAVISWRLYRSALHAPRAAHRSVPGECARIFAEIPSA